MKLELPSSFRPSQKLEVRLEKGKSLGGTISHKSLAEIIVQTRVGELILPFSDERLSRGQKVVVFRDNSGRMFLDTSPGDFKLSGKREVAADVFRSGKSVILDGMDVTFPKNSGAPDKPLKSGDVYSRLLNNQNPGQALFGVIIKKTSAGTEANPRQSVPSHALKNEIPKYVVESGGTQFKISSPHQLNPGDFISFLPEKSQGGVNINILPQEKAIPPGLQDILNKEGVKYQPEIRMAYDKLEHFKNEPFFARAVLDFGEIIKASGILQTEPPVTGQPVAESASTTPEKSNTPNEITPARGLIKFFFNFSVPAEGEAPKRAGGQTAALKAAPAPTVTGSPDVPEPKVSEKGSSEKASPRGLVPGAGKNESAPGEGQKQMPVKPDVTVETTPAGREKTGASPDVNPAKVNQGDLLPRQINPDTPILSRSVREYFPAGPEQLEQVFSRRNALIDVMYSFSRGEQAGEPPAIPVDRPIARELQTPALAQVNPDKPSSQVPASPASGAPAVGESAAPIVPGGPIRPEPVFDTSVDKLLSLFLGYNRDTELPRAQAAVWGMMIKFPALGNYLLEQFIPADVPEDSREAKKTGDLLVDVGEKQLMFKDKQTLPSINSIRPFSLFDFYSELARKDSPENLNVDLKLQKFVMEAIQSDITSGDSRGAENSLSGFTWMEDRWQRVRFQFNKKSDSRDKSDNVNLDIELETKNMQKVVLQVTIESEGARIHIKHEKGNIESLLPDEIKLLEKSLHHLDFKVLHWKTSRLPAEGDPGKSRRGYRGSGKAKSDASDGLDIEA